MNRRFDSNPFLNRQSSIVNRQSVREIIHVDIAAFAVAVERVVHPELRRRPVVVAPIGRARSIVTAVSPEAWSAGVRKGMVLAKAVRYCREAVILPPNDALYARAARAVCNVLQGFSPLLEPAGYGHVYLDITGTGRLFGPPRDTAWRAQNEIRRQLRLEASLGVGSNKMVSRIAAAVIEPDGLQDIRHGDEPSFLAPLPVRMLPGVGPEREEQLRELNLRIIRDITAMELGHLTLAFGRFGFVLYQRALGIDNTPVHPPRELRCVDEEKVLAEDSNDLGLLKASVSELCERAGERLRENRERAGRLELRVRYSDYQENAGKEKLLPPLQSSAALYARTGPLLERVLARRTRVRSLHLRLSDLTRGPAQLDLFADPRPERQARLESALDLLRRRYGSRVCSSPRRLEDSKEHKRIL